MPSGGCARSSFAKVCKDFDARLVEMDGEHAHVHLLLAYPLKVAVSALVNSLKGVSSRRLRKDWADLAARYWKGMPWSLSYFAAACGGAPLSASCGSTSSSSEPRTERTSSRSRALDPALKDGACRARGKVGIVPGDGGCWLLPRVVGASRAAELALTGETIDADEALRIGLVSRVVEPEALLDSALELAGRIAANPPQALRWTKRLLQQGRTGSLDEALDAAGRLQGLAHQTAEHAEAVAAFFEKRPPVFEP